MTQSEGCSMSPKSSLRPSTDGSGSDEVPMTSQTRTRTYLFTAILACGSLSFGMPVGLTAPLASLKPLNLCLPPEFQGDVTSFALFSSILNIGAMFGAFCGGVLADKLGRRVAFIISCVISASGSCGIIFGSSMPILNAGRFVNGFSVGLFSLLIPMYMSEIAPASMRGTMGTCHSLGITVGITIAIALGLPIADNLEWWRYVAAMSTAPVFILLLAFIFYIPETPRWLLTQGRVPHALDALKRLRGSTFDADAEMKQLQLAQQESARQHGPSSVMQQLQLLFSLQYRRPILIALGLQLAQQVTGINGVLFFLGDLFSVAAQTCDSENVRSAIKYSILGGGINVIGSVLSLFVTEKAGRRLQLSLSLAGMGAFLAMGGCAIWFNWASAAQKVAVLFYIFFFAIGCGPVPWIMMSEVMPSRVRGPALSLGTLWNWLLAFIVVLITPTLATVGSTPAAAGPFAQFWMFAAVCAVGLRGLKYALSATDCCRRCVVALVWVNTTVPETKGRTLEEIEVLMVKGHPYSASSTSVRLLNSNDA